MRKKLVDKDYLVPTLDLNLTVLLKYSKKKH